MKTYSISGLARACGLSRSTLLYYDRLGLLKPSGRTGSGYRSYTESEQRRLERIGHFREAGLTLKEIRAVLSSGGKPGTRLLEKRLRETSEEIVGLKNQQRLLAGMLRQVASGKRPSTVGVRLWVEMLRAAGMDQDGMHRWHSEFERRAPTGHQEFLLSLGIPPVEVARVRRLSRGEWKLFIDAPRVLLRRFRPEDAGKFFQMGQENEMRTWLPSHAFRDEAHAGSVLEYVIKQYDTGADPRTVPIVFAVQLKTTGELVGHAGLVPSEDGVEVTFAIEDAQQRKGFATEAVKAVCSWATSIYPIKRIYGTPAKQNIASQRVLEKAGFARQKEQETRDEGTEREVVVFEYSRKETRTRRDRRSPASSKAG
jgi:DNA-binding transcriptional MerR regulator/RimJ/RimL family protein N-acetyltransferase